MKYHSLIRGNKFHFYSYIKYFFQRKVKASSIWPANFRTKFCEREVTGAGGQERKRQCGISDYCEAGIQIFLKGWLWTTVDIKTVWQCFFFNVNIYDIAGNYILNNYLSFRQKIVIINKKYVRTHSFLTILLGILVQRC